MTKISFFVLPIIFILTSNLSAQIELHLTLQEEFELPGNMVLDFQTIDINNDGILDFAYHDSSNAYLIDGSSHQEIASIPVPSGSSIMKIGDLNNDSLEDVAFCGAVMDHPDSDFITVFMAPNYTESHSLVLYGRELGIETITSLYFTHIFGYNLIFLGTYLYQGDSNYYTYTGRLRIFEFDNGQFTSRSDSGPLGQVLQIENFEDANERLLILRTKSTFVQGPYPPHYHYWMDLFVVDSLFNTMSIYNVDQGMDGESIPNLYVARPETQDNDYIFFRRNSQGDSIICIDQPNGHIAWEAGFTCHDCAMYFTSTYVFNDEFRDLFLWQGLGVLIRNPFNGYLEDIGLLTGYRGYPFPGFIDLQNDGIDEFLSHSMDSLCIYHLDRPTSINADEDSITADSEKLVCFPNPFNSKTTFKFNIKCQAYADLDIFDILGRHVISLASKQFQPGSYEITWDASTVSSGIYFAIMRQADSIKRVKLILMK